MASESNFVQETIPHFDGHYDHWSMLMKNFLRSKEYWPIVEDRIGTPAEETSKDIWDSMKKKYQCTTRVKRAQLQALRRDFETLQMKEGETILLSLSSKYGYFVCSIEESKDIDVLSLDELRNSLLVDELKMNISSTFEEHAWNASTFIPSNSRGRGRGRGRGRRDRENRDGGNKEGSRNFRANDDYGRGRGRDFDKSKVECYRCHKFGHYRSECRTRLPSEKEEKSNFAENKEGETLLMAVHVENES
ncbi:uncharacterized protein [Solanum tuberosum]|uniref:uncharacterized protein n=1 Tax=Solanum tuberosum TaxID=4113 RepID=UPI000739FDA2|nr:PREDICTED: uncharacterized protein LOC107063368 [Solanum tuberosum]